MAEKIVLDTNFLLVPGRFKVDIFSELRRGLDSQFELYIPDICLGELQKLASGRGKVGSEAKLGLKLAEKKGVKVMDTGRKGHADDIIVALAEKERFITATQDLSLAKRLKGKGLRVIVLRGKSHLEVV